MRRRHRIVLVLVFLLGGLLAVGGLTALSAASEGPLSTALGWIGAAAGSIEHRVRDRIAGPGRRTALEWAKPYRDDAERLRRPDRMLVGAYDSGLPRTLDGVVELERHIGTTLPLVQVYGAWGDKPEQQFPRKLLTAIRGMGSIPVVTWEPWLSDFESARHPHLPLRDARDRHGLGAIARGEYDFYIDAWAEEAKRFGHPMLVRFAHEMNDPYRYPWGPQHNSKEEFIAAWRHVVERFRNAGADNVVWVWSPHVAYEFWDHWYPGGEYVDWVATGVLNFGPIAQWSRWWSFDEIFGTKYPRLAELGKPVMIAELGSLAVGGDRAAWYADALTDLPRRYPAVRAVLLFHARDDQTVTYQKVDWTVADDSVVAGRIRRAMEGWGQGTAH